MGLSSILGEGLGSFAEKVGGVVDRFVHTKDEKAAVMLELEGIKAAAETELEQTMRTELQAKERIMVAELEQGDKYTKRARPTVVYAGLVFIFLVYVVIPLVVQFTGTEMPALELPAEFWYGWSGIVATWTVSRTMERRGSANNLVSVVTGNKRSGLMD